MALKISFETDVKGFSRVEQALTTQKKLIDDSADAMKRLQGAKQGLGKTEDDTKGNESLKVTAKRVEDLTGALATLTKSQSGLKGFMDLFGGFNKQLTEFGKSASTQVLDTMTKQIDLLKGSINSAGQTLKNLQADIKVAREAGRIEEAVQKEHHAAQLGTKMMGETALLKDLQVSKFMNRPVGSFFGEGGGGPSIGGLMSGAGRAYGALYAGARLAEFGADKFLNYSYSGERSERALFGREVSVAQGAQGGNISRQFMLNRGLGVEGEFRAGTLVNDEDDSLAAGNFSLRGLGERLRLGGRHLKGMLTGDFKTNRELVEERGAELAALDEKRGFALNKAGQMMNTLVRNPTYDNLARRMGEGGIRSMLANINTGGATQNEALSVLETMTGYGTTRAFKEVSEAQVVPGQSPEDRFYNDPRAIFSASRKLGLSDSTTAELSRQSYYRPPSEVIKDAGAVINEAGSRTVASDRILTDFGARMQALNETAGIPMSEVTGVAQATAQRLNTPANFVTAQPNLDAVTANTAAVQAQRFMQDRGNTGGTLASLAQTQALHSLGVRNPLMVQQIQQLISEGNLSKSVELIGKISGAPAKDIMEKINQAGAAPFKFVEQLTGADKRSKFEQEKFQEVMGVPLSRAVMGGGATKTLTAGLAALDTQHAIFDAKTMADIEAGKPVGQGRTGVPIVQTSKDELAKAEAGQDKALMDATKAIAEAVGDKTGAMIVNEIARGYIEMGNKIKESVNQLSSEAKPKEADKAFGGTRYVPGL